jgi:hypothetical protein
MIGIMLAAALLQTDAACNAVGAPAPRGCPPWQALYRGDNGVVFSDPAPLRRRANGFDLRVRLVFPTDQESGMRSAIAVYRFDCAAQTATLQHNSVYAANGRQIVEGPVTNAAVLAAPPGTPNRAALDRFCPRR